MTVGAGGAQQVAFALSEGEVVVLYCNVASGINEARTAARRASAWVHAVAGAPTLRLCRSATRGMGVVAAHRACSVGIDVEGATTERVFDGMATTLLHADEFDTVLGVPLAPADIAHVWVRKEATLKSFGVGLAVPPASIITGGYNERWHTVTHGILGTAVMRSLKAPEGFAVALALLGERPASVSVFVYDSGVGVS